ncbi:MAG: shikimate kinase [Planctomycetota bacterium]|nr:MAG: shikimate kinase [Planctomycetota bacterium]
MTKNNLLLTGFMGVGKTTLGKLLAQRLNMGFVDTDQEIEKEYGPISCIFENYGEPYFRDLEWKVAQKLVLQDNQVISTGGGFLINPKIRELFKDYPVVVLWANPKDLKIRLSLAHNRRPLLENKRLSWQEIFQNRKNFYLSFSHHLDTSGKSIEEALFDLEKLWKAIIQ